MAAEQEQCTEEMRNINEKLNQAQMEAKEATSKAVELESAKKKS